MDHVDTNVGDMDLDIDLESGGTTSDDENNSKSRITSCKTSKKQLGGMRSGFMNSDSQSKCKTDGDCSSCSFEQSTISDKISAENKEQLGKYKEDDRMSLVNKMSNEERSKKQNYGNACKPPRPPKGPSLKACDMKLMKEITVLNLKRKRMERRTSRKIRKDKPSSWSCNILACLVTLLFLAVIIFQAQKG